MSSIHNRTHLEQLLANRMEMKATVGGERNELGLLDIVLAIFYFARNLNDFVGKAICKQLVWEIYAQAGRFLTCTTFEIMGGLVFNSEVDGVLDELVAMDYLRSAVNHSYRITDSGLWLFDSRVRQRVFRNSSVYEVLENLRFVLPEISRCSLEEALTRLYHHSTQASAGKNTIDGEEKKRCTDSEMKTIG